MTGLLGRIALGSCPQLAPSVRIPIRAACKRPMQERCARMLGGMSAHATSHRVEACAFAPCLGGTGYGRRLLACGAGGGVEASIGAAPVHQRTPPQPSGKSPGPSPPGGAPSLSAPPTPSRPPALLPVVAGGLLPSPLPSDTPAPQLAESAVLFIGFPPAEVAHIRTCTSHIFPVDPSENGGTDPSTEALVPIFNVGANRVTQTVAELLLAAQSQPGDEEAEEGGLAQGRVAYFYGSIRVSHIHGVLLN
eukprot:gene18097-24526_t